MKQKYTFFLFSLEMKKIDRKFVCFCYFRRLLLFFILNHELKKKNLFHLNVFKENVWKNIKKYQIFRQKNHGIDIF